MRALATAGPQHGVDGLKPLAGLFGILVLDVLDVGHRRCRRAPYFGKKVNSDAVLRCRGRRFRDARDDPVLTHFGQASDIGQECPHSSPEMARRGCDCCQDSLRPLAQPLRRSPAAESGESPPRRGPAGCDPLAGPAPARCGRSRGRSHDDARQFPPDAGRAGLLPQGCRRIRAVARCRLAGAAHACRSGRARAASQSWCRSAGSDRSAWQEALYAALAAHCFHMPSARRSPGVNARRLPSTSSVPRSSTCAARPAPQRPPTWSGT